VEVLFRHLPGGSAENHEKKPSVRKVPVPGEIRTEHLSSISLKRYC
jgi:hypothetical protein